VLRANKQVEVIFGYRRDEVVGKPVDNLFPPRYRFMHKNYRHKLLSDPSYRQEGGGVELYALRSDSSEFPVDVVLSPIQTSDGLQTISAIRDVTERKQIEAELAEVQRRLIDSLEAERLILAQEIHDGAIQDLYGVTYAIRGLEGVMEERNILSDGLEFLNTSKESIQQAINTLRSICGELRPPALAPFGLEKAITAHIEQLRDAHPALTIHSELFPDGQTLPEHMRMVLYRIYQHAVSNVLRHASAKNLWVSFSNYSEQVTLTVRDDGVGFNLPSRWVELAREGHLGLIGTAERAEALGAQLNISSEPGSGTTIEVVVPLGKPYEPNLQSTRWLLYKK
jgi:PAS domain S-box-containing protein